MATWKIIAMAIVWVFTSAFIAVVTAAVISELLRLAGLVTPGESSYQVALNTIFVVVWLMLIAIPFVFRSRFTTREPPPSS